jgi:hypothetical protein
MRLLAWPALAAGLALMVCACGGNTGPNPTPGSAPAAGSSASPPPAAPSLGPLLSGSPSPEAEAQAAAIDAARRDAAQRLNTTPESLQLDVLESRQWADRSLGCPRQGVLYAQIVTPGYIIILSSGGRRLEYHADDRGMAVFCQEQQ